jgi:hypothetical protein
VSNARYQINCRGDNNIVAAGANLLHLFFKEEEVGLCVNKEVKTSN